MASVTLLLRSLRRRETHAVSAYKFVFISPYSRELFKRRWEEDGAPVRRSQRYNRRCVW
ncbi:hypothetical protein HID58_029532 [Brassica napus]|uniref:Uncharacterized protein n=1 Tax=Brassica napus TaxID=3708 RepID=A0ABQ8CDD8_BRANA|nr:hypothetical protein HID58_029532 [Brassica napus]